MTHTAINTLMCSVIHRIALLDNLGMHIKVWGIRDKITDKRYSMIRKRWGG